MLKYIEIFESFYEALKLIVKVVIFTIFNNEITIFTTPAVGEQGCVSIARN